MIQKWYFLVLTDTGIQGYDTGRFVVDKLKITNKPSSHDVHCDIVNSEGVKYVKILTKRKISCIELIDYH